VQQKLAVSERRACRVLGQPRSTQRRTLVVCDDKDALTQAIIDLASEYGRYGYRRITTLLRDPGGLVIGGWSVRVIRFSAIPQDLEKLSRNSCGLLNPEIRGDHPSRFR
jgi:putative transposase